MEDANAEIDAGNSPAPPPKEGQLPDDALNPPTSTDPIPRLRSSPEAEGDHDDKKKQVKNAAVAVAPPVPTANGNSVAKAGRDLVALKREIGLFSAVTIILGNIIGSGIFITPTNVYTNAGSFGMSMVVWIVSGLFSLVGALCFVELGTTIVSSGAEYAYVKEAFGDIPAFLILWINLIIIIPTGHIIVALTFGYYLVDPFYPDPTCPPPDMFVRIVAVLVQGRFCFVSML